jgi:hypothetical protein
MKASCAMSSAPSASPPTRAARATARPTWRSYSSASRRDEAEPVIAIPSDHSIFILDAQTRAFASARDDFSARQGLASAKFGAPADVHRSGTSRS